jgi:hypothetical protein
LRHPQVRSLTHLQQRHGRETISGRRASHAEREVECIARDVETRRGPELFRDVVTLARRNRGERFATSREAACARAREKPQRRPPRGNSSFQTSTPPATHDGCDLGPARPSAVHQARVHFRDPALTECRREIPASVRSLGVVVDEEHGRDPSRWRSRFSRGRFEVSSKYSWMTRSDPEERKRRTFGPSSALFPVSQGVHADAHGVLGRCPHDDHDTPCNWGV